MQLLSFAVISFALLVVATTYTTRFTAWLAGLSFPFLLAAFFCVMYLLVRLVLSTWELGCMAGVNAFFAWQVWRCVKRIGWERQKRLSILTKARLWKGAAAQGDGRPISVVVGQIVEAVRVEGHDHVSEREVRRMLIHLRYPGSRG